MADNKKGLGLWSMYENSVYSLFGLRGKSIESEQPISTEAHGGGFASGESTHIFAVPFDGEKNSGEIGHIKDYSMQYSLLRLRSWQSYVESEITQTIIHKYIKWVIGSGLRLQAEPIKTILEEEGINTKNLQNFTKSVEARFNLFAKSRRSDYSGMSSLNKISSKAYKSAIVGGDVLVILRLVKGEVKVQIVDGQHVKRKTFGNDYFPEKLENGNVIKNGIELSPTGEHIAYHVSEDPLKESKRIKARTKRGVVQAFLLYGREYRLDNHRGLPWIAVVLETLKKMERYKEASVGSAEEVAKIVYFIKHGLGSTGENPLNKNLAKAFNADDKGGTPKDINGTELANTIAASTDKQTFNMPNDSSLEQLSHKNNIYFKEFYTTNIEIIAACLNIPPDVAMSMYNNSFSASRAALKDWEHTLIVDRDAFKDGFLQHVYNYWFEVMVHNNKITAEGYINAGNNEDLKEAFRTCRFVGANVPHIDPLKEVMAERAKLGDAGKALPLTTPEKATEALNSGDYEQNMENFAEAKKIAEEKGIKVEEKGIEEVKEKKQEN